MRPMLIQILRWLKQAKVWSFVVFASYAVGLLCFAFSSSFTGFFGKRTWWKVFLFIIVTSIICLPTLLYLFAKRRQDSTISWLGVNFSYLVLIITSAYSFFFDERTQGSKPDAYILVSLAAFAIASLGLSRQIRYGFVVDLLSFFCGSLTILLMKIKVWFFFVGACFSCFLINLRAYLELDPLESDAIPISQRVPLSSSNDPVNHVPFVQVHSDSEETNTGAAIQFDADTGAQSVGVCYGGIGNNLPTKQAVVDLYKSNRIGKIRLYYPDEGILQALRGSNIEVILDVPNEHLHSVTDARTATNWVNKYVKAYSPGWVNKYVKAFSPGVKFKYITVGNEVHPGYALDWAVLPALYNIQKAISSANLQGQIKVSTAIDTTLLGNSYPPENGVFRNNANQYIREIIDFLVQNGAPLLANVYPYFAYVNNQQSIGLDYALFTKRGKNDVGYQNLFDAMLDSLYAALEKVGAPNVKVVVSESGWPSQGAAGASVQNARTYYRNLVSHVKGGTPKRPNEPIETYLFAMFDENQKQGPEIERHFGLFTPDKLPKY